MIAQCLQKVIIKFWLGENAMLVAFLIGTFTCYGVIFIISFQSHY